MNQHFTALRTSAIVDKANVDRPTFAARLCRTFGGAKPCQVFCSFESMLLLPVVEAGGTTENNAGGAVVAGAILGGMVGSALGSIVADNLKTTSVGPLAENFSLMSDDESSLGPGNAKEASSASIATSRLRASTVRRFPIGCFPARGWWGT